MVEKPQKVHIDAKNLDLALVRAASALGVSQDEVVYEIVKQTERGLFSFFTGQKVEIVAWRKSKGPNRHHNKQAPTGPRRGASARPSHDRFVDNDNDRSIEREDSNIEKRQLSNEEINTLKEDLRSFCQEICCRMVGEGVSVNANLEDGRLVLDVDNEFLANQIVKSSKLAESLEHVLRKKPHHLHQELPFRIFVDAKGFRRQREGELIQMAHDLSFKVHDSQRPIVLNYKSSYDRKIIHMTLDKDQRVYTKSIGSGPNRKLMILPSKRSQEYSESRGDAQVETCDI